MRTNHVLTLKGDLGDLLRAHPTKFQDSARTLEVCTIIAQWIFDFQGFSKNVTT